MVPKSDPKSDQKVIQKMTPNMTKTRAKFATKKGTNKCHTIENLTDTVSTTLFEKMQFRVGNPTKIAPTPVRGPIPKNVYFEDVPKMASKLTKIA